MKNNICVIHNGDTEFLKEVQNKFSLQKFPCFVTDWGARKTVDDKLNMLNSGGYIFDISTADDIDYDILMEIKKTTEIIKLLTPYDIDVKDTSNIWGDHLSKDLHYHALTKYMTFADTIISYLPEIEATVPIIFSPGRCGTHLLQSILFKDFPDIKYIHHNSFQHELLNKKSFLIIRRNLRDFVLSMLISKKYDTLVTYESNKIEAEQMISTWVPFAVTFDDVKNQIYCLLHFLDFALLLKKLGLVNSFSYYEDLDLTKLTKPIFKNGYDKEKLIINIEEVNSWISSFNNYDLMFKNVVTKYWQ